MKVYIAFEGDYEQRRPIGVYTSRAMAERAGLHGDYSDYQGFEVDDSEPSGALLWGCSFRLEPGVPGLQEYRHWHGVVDTPEPLQVDRGPTSFLITGSHGGEVSRAMVRLRRAHDRPIEARRKKKEDAVRAEWETFAQTLSPHDPTYPEKISAWWAERENEPL